jgi:hypothetical protein
MITPEGAALQAMNQSNSTQQRPRNRRFLDENQLIEDAFRLGVQVFESGFRPNFIVGLWRGGSTVGIYVQECLQTLGVKTDHIALRTSYRGMDHYDAMVAAPEAEIRVHGTHYGNSEKDFLIWQNTATPPTEFPDEADDLRRRRVRWQAQANPQGVVPDRDGSGGAVEGLDCFDRATLSEG